MTYSVASQPIGAPAISTAGATPDFLRETKPAVLFWDQCRWGYAIHPSSAITSMIDRARFRFVVTAVRHSAVAPSRRHAPPSTVSTESIFCPLKASPLHAVGVSCTSVASGRARSLQTGDLPPLALYRYSVLMQYHSTDWQSTGRAPLGTIACTLFGI